MDLMMFAVQDLKAGSWNAPFTAINVETAKRQVVQWLLNPQTTIAQFPEDFRLFSIGTYNVDTGYVVGVGPEFICDCLSLKG